MLALDNGDKLQGDTTTASKVDYTINGVVSNAIAQLADGQLADSKGDIYTSVAAGTVVASITLVNTNSTSEAVNLYLLPAGGTARHLIPNNMTLAAGYSVVYDGQKMQVFDTSGNVCYATSAAISAHAASHAVGATDTLYPADPDADQYLMWDDSESAFAWGNGTIDGEVRLTPKESSTGPEGTVFYDSVDKCIYVGVEGG